MSEIADEITEDFSEVDTGIAAEVEDFTDELTKILIRLKETAREKYTPKSKMTQKLRESIAHGRAVADAIDTDIRRRNAQNNRSDNFNDFLVYDGEPSDNMADMDEFDESLFGPSEHNT